MQNAQNVGIIFSPLDRELGLLPKKRYTPQIQASMTRLGAKLPFEEATEEVLYAHKVKVSERTTRKITHENGEAMVEIIEKQVEKLKKEAPVSEKKPETVQLSADGCFLCTTSGEWKEIKTVAIGEVQTEWNAEKSKFITQTNGWSYYSSSATIREFEDGALAELHERGIENAKMVVSVNDGSKWIQSLTDYHCPDALRILDFSHAAEHVASAGKAVMGENSDRFRTWYADASARLKGKPPEQTLARLYLLHRQTDDPATRAKIMGHIDYLERRNDQIDYPFFQARHLPIGSGSVESAHKHVVQKRMKQAGMRWAPEHLDPMLALRNLISNGRWASGWADITQHRLNLLDPSKSHPAPDPIVTPPVTLNSVKAKPPAPDSSSTQTAVPYKPAPDHPWRHAYSPHLR